MYTPLALFGIQTVQGKVRARACCVMPVLAVHCHVLTNVSWDSPDAWTTAQFQARKTVAHMHITSLGAMLEFHHVPGTEANTQKPHSLPYDISPDGEPQLVKGCSSFCR